MQGNRKVYKRTFFGLVIFSTLMSFQTHAQVATTQEFDEIEHVVGGDTCRAVNVNKAIRSIQYLRGAIVNNSQTESINVTCPITIFPPVEDLLILMTHKPQSSIRCVVRQFSYGEEVSGRIVEQHTSYAGIPFEMFLDERLNFEVGMSGQEYIGQTVNVTCTLPPGFKITMLRLIQNYFKSRGTSVPIY